MFLSTTERRPPKTTLPTPIFRSPSARLQRDLIEDDRGEYCVDGLNLASSLGGSHNEVHHYSFKPSKQIVSTEINLFIVSFRLNFA
jgi:hypothetical protein